VRRVHVHVPFQQFSGKPKNRVREELGEGEPERHVRLGDRPELVARQWAGEPLPLYTPLSPRLHIHEGAVPHLEGQIAGEGPRRKRHRRGRSTVSEHNDRVYPALCLIAVAEDRMDHRKIAYGGVTEGTEGEGDSSLTIDERNP